MEKSNNFKSKFKIIISKTPIGFLFLSLPLILMDVFIRTISDQISYNPLKAVFPSISFSFIWIFLIVFVSLTLKGKAGKILYSVCFGFFFAMFLTQVIYFPYTQFFFNFTLLNSAEEGAHYIWEVVKGASWTSSLMIISSLALGILSIVFFPKKEKNHWKTLCTGLVVFIILHTLIPFAYGAANDSLQWDNWRNPRNVYNSFSDGNKNMKICGFYEYTLRDIYVTFIKPDEKITPEEDEFLKAIYDYPIQHEKNGYTGIFEGKNVIFLQLEGIDSWMLTRKDMPNLYNLTKNAFVFNDHYSYYNGGGSTFNSELAVSTGLITPISFVKNAYSFTNNSFPYSLPKKFKEIGYAVNAFHMNTGEYYSRELNYKNWGYDNYYSLLDTKKYKDFSYQLDSELIENETFYNRLFKQKGPFLHYIITYTPHTPFNFESDMGKLLAKRLYGDDVPTDYDEEKVARIFAAETDNMVGLLLKGLEDNNLIDDTVIVAFSDHYLYTLNDKTILDKYKKTENNLINETPFFIWSKDMESKKFFKANSQLDILPTVLNLFGIDFIDQHYIGRDILDPNHNGYVFFPDRSWYDGKYYVADGEVTNKDKYDEDYISDVNALINKRIRQNDLILKYDYFKKKD